MKVLSCLNDQVAASLQDRLEGFAVLENVENPVVFLEVLNDPKRALPDAVITGTQQILQGSHLMVPNKYGEANVMASITKGVQLTIVYGTCAFELENELSHMPLSTLNLHFVQMGDYQLVKFTLYLAEGNEGSRHA